MIPNPGNNPVSYEDALVARGAKRGKNGRVQDNDKQAKQQGGQ